MPELPEVETTRRGIAPELTGLVATGAVILACGGFPHDRQRLAEQARVRPGLGRQLADEEREVASKLRRA